MSAGLDNFFAQEGIEDQEDFDMPASDGSEQHIKNDSPNANISRALDEGSNGSMDGMLKTCFEDGVSGEPNEPMDVSITEDSTIVNLESEDEANDKEMISSDKDAASSDKEPASSDVEEVAEETSDDVEAIEEAQGVVEEPMSDDAVEDAIDNVVEDAVEDIVEDAVEDAVEGVVEVVAEDAVKGVVEDVAEDAVKGAVEDAVEDVVEVVPQVARDPAPEVDETSNTSEEMEQQEKEITTVISTDDEKSSESKKDHEMDEGEVRSCILFLLLK